MHAKTGVWMLSLGGSKPSASTKLGRQPNDKLIEQRRTAFNRCTKPRCLPQQGQIGFFEILDSPNPVCVSPIGCTKHHCWWSLRIRTRTWTVVIGQAFAADLSCAGKASTVWRGWGANTISVAGTTHRKLVLASVQP